MISYQEALKVIREVAMAERGRERELPATEALKTVLARPVLGPEDVPLFDNSAMDGFAVSAKRTENASPGAPVSFPVKGFLAAGGDPKNVFCGGNGAIEIMTGAPMPPAPLDAVVRVEDVEINTVGGERYITLRKPVRSGENVRTRGSDFRSGCEVAPAGRLITPAHVMAFASMGIKTVSVHARPKVAIVSTGSELRDVGEERTLSSQIWNSSGPYLEHWLRDYGCDVRNLGTVGDDPGAFQRLVREGLEWGADLVLSTGAVSMGKHDFVAEAFRSMGAETYFHKVAIRPGKPICFGEFRSRAGRPVFFGLPGNPVSTAVGLRFFVVPYLRALSRLGPERGFIASLAAPVSKPERFRCFYKAKARVGILGAEAEVLAGQGSYVVSALLEANCWAVLPEPGDSLPEGTPIEVFSLNGTSEGGIGND